MNKKLILLPYTHFGLNPFGINMSTTNSSIECLQTNTRGGTECLRSNWFHYMIALYITRKIPINFNNNSGVFPVPKQHNRHWPPLTNGISSSCQRSSVANYYLVTTPDPAPRSRAHNTHPHSIGCPPPLLPCAPPQSPPPTSTTTAYPITANTILTAVSTQPISPKWRSMS